MDNLSIITFIILLFGNIDTLLIYDLATETRPEYGNLEVQYLLKSVNLFYINHGSWQGCDTGNGQVNIYTLCDLYMTAFSYSSDKHYTTAQFTDIALFKYKFIQNPLPSDIVKGNDVSLVLTDQANYVIYANPRFVSMVKTRQKTYYYFEYHICEDFVAQTRAPYGVYYIYIYESPTQIGVKENIHINPVTYTKTESRVVVMKRTTCDDHWYGETCWYNCIDNQRKSCNCDETKRESIYPCAPKCNEMWLYTFVQYTVGKKKYILKDCSVYNKCYHDTKCTNNQHCFQFDNSTSMCYVIRLKYFQMVANLPEDMKEIIFYQDTIFINITDFPHVNLQWNYSIELIKNTLGFQQRTFRSVEGNSIPAFYVRSNEFIDQNLAINAKLMWRSLLATVSVTRYFRIFEKPNKIEVIDNVNNSIIKKYIYHGQSITCRSNSKPDYRSIYLWKTYLTKRLFTTDIKIDNNQPISTYFVYCEVNLIVYNQSNVKFGEKFKFGLRPYVSFGWNITNNILESSSVVMCNSFDYVNGHIKILQLEGYSDVSGDKILTFYNSIGGSYTFICVWSNNFGISVTRTTKFKLRTSPNEVCFFLFPATPGGLIQCFHNGHIKDEFTVEVSVKVFSTQEISVIRQLNYVRLPYKSVYNKILVTCNVTGIIYSNLKKSYFENFNIKRTSTGTYTFSKKFKDCPTFTKYIEKPSIVNNNNEDTIILNHKIYELKYCFKCNYFEFLVILSFAIIDIFFLLLVFLFQSFSAKYSSQYYVIHALFIRKSRNLNDNLNRIVRDKLNINRTKFSLAFTTMKFQNDDEEVF